MKKFSKILSVALLVALVLSLGVANAFAADPPSKGSVTVNPNFKDQTYTLFKLFDAQITFAADGETVAAITYTVPDKGTAAKDEDLGDGTAWFHINDNGFVEANDGLENEWGKDKAAITWAESFGTQVGDPITADSDNDVKVKWTGLDFGYYYVKTTLGSFIGIDSAAADVTIQDKNEKPSIDKSITGVKDAAGTPEGSVFDATIDAEKADVGQGKDEQAIAQVGDTVSYKLVVNVKPGAKNYVITDTMTNLALVANSVMVKNGSGDAVAYSASPLVDNTTAGATNVVDQAASFKITLDQDWLDNVTEATTVTITYDAVLTANAVVADEANPNEVKLVWGDNPEDNHSEDQSKVWTAKVGVDKRINKEDGEPLEGAGFVLKKKNADLYYKRAADSDVVTWVTDIKEATVLSTGSNGKLTKDFTGLVNGTYTLIETVVPAGYNKLDDTDFTINEANVELSNLAQTKIVVNNSGTTLPSTGGIGTTIFYVVGGVLVLAAIILLVTKKRMSE